MLIRRSASGLLLCLLSVPTSARSQGPIAPPRPLKDAVRDYENSAEGLRWQLQDILSSARNPGRDRLDSLIRETEIPYYADWFVASFGKEKGQIWAQSYKQNLPDNEKHLADVMVQLSEEDGEFSVRAINDDPAPAREIEGEMVDSLQRPVDIFFASWRKRGLSPSFGSSPIGYFVFLGGRFRFDSAIRYADIQLNPAADDAKARDASSAQAGLSSNRTPASPANDPLRAGVGEIGYPTCKVCPDPVYSQLAKDDRLEGTVVLQATVQPDGSVTDIRVIKSADPELSRMAVEGVSSWQLSPARRADGEPVAVRISFEIIFRLAKSKRP